MDCFGYVRGRFGEDTGAAERRLMNDERREHNQNFRPARTQGRYRKVRGSFVFYVFVTSGRLALQNCASEWRFRMALQHHLRMRASGLHLRMRAQPRSRKRFGSSTAHSHWASAPSTIQLKEVSKTTFVEARQGRPTSRSPPPKAVSVSSALDGSLGGTAAIAWAHAIVRDTAPEAPACQSTFPTFWHTNLTWRWIGNLVSQKPQRDRSAAPAPPISPCQQQSKNKEARAPRGYNPNPNLRATVSSLHHREDSPLELMSEPRCHHWKCHVTTQRQTFTGRGPSSKHKYLHRSPFAFAGT
jgi:hypothetical protein